MGQPTRDHPHQTEIEGIALTGERGMFRGQDYAVSFTLYLDASSPEEAGARAMQFRNAVAGWPDMEPGFHHKLPFDWHLEDHDGC